MVNKSILNDTPEILIRKFKQLLIKNKISIEKVILFGSRAKGNAKYYSDIDLCVVSKSFGKDYHDEMIKLMTIASEVEPMIEPHPYHPKDLKDKWDPLAHEIRKHGIVV